MDGKGQTGEGRKVDKLVVKAYVMNPRDGSENNNTGAKDRKRRRQK